MKYIIKRISNRYVKPCEEAFEWPYYYWHTRTCSEEYFNEKFSHKEGLWRDKGLEHQTTQEGYITRKEGSENVWTVEINNLEELNLFCDKYGELVVRYDEYHKSPSIEIYDDYRE